MSIIEKKSLVLKEKFLKYESVFDLFKKLYNLSKMLTADQHFDNCYCNVSKNQCWLCNLSDYVRHSDIENDLLRYRKQEDSLVDIAFRLLYYIKRIKNDNIENDDKKFALNFFKRKFDCATSFNEVIKSDLKNFKKSIFRLNQSFNFLETKN